MEWERTPYVCVVISPCWLIHISIKLLLCLIYKASSKFLFCQHLQLWLSFKSTPMSPDRTWSSQENWRWTEWECTFLVLCLLMRVLSTHCTMNWKMRKEQFNKHSFDLKGKMSIYSCFKYVSKMRVQTWEWQVLEKRSQLIFKKCQLSRYKMKCNKKNNKNQLWKQIFFIDQDCIVSTAIQFWYTMPNKVPKAQFLIL